MDEYITNELDTGAYSDENGVEKPNSQLSKCEIRQWIIIGRLAFLLVKIRGSRSYENLCYTLSKGFNI